MIQALRTLCTVTVSAFAPGRTGLRARAFARARRPRHLQGRWAGLRLLILRRAIAEERGATRATVIHVGVQLSWAPALTIVRSQGMQAAATKRVEKAAVGARLARRRAPAGVTARSAPPTTARILRRGALADPERGAPVLRIVRAAVSRNKPKAPARAVPEARNVTVPPAARLQALERGEARPRAGVTAELAALAARSTGRGGLRVEERTLAPDRRSVVARPARHAESVPVSLPAPVVGLGRAPVAATAQAARAAIDVEALTNDVMRRIDRRVTAWRERTGRL